MTFESQRSAFFVDFPACSPFAVVKQFSVRSHKQHKNADERRGKGNFYSLRGPFFAPHHGASREIKIKFHRVRGANTKSRVVDVDDRMEILTAAAASVTLFPLSHSAFLFLFVFFSRWFLIKATCWIAQCFYNAEWRTREALARAVVGRTFVGWNVFLSLFSASTAAPQHLTIVTWTRSKGNKLPRRHQLWPLRCCCCC